MKIKVDTEVVAGTDRGGEDLFLVIEAESDAKDDNALIEELDGLKERINELLDELGQRDPDDSEIWSEKGRVKSTPTEYEFSIDMSEPEFAKLLTEVVGDLKKWSQKRPHGDEKWKWTLNHFHLVTGNAD